MEITKLEKAALLTTGAAAAYKTLLWSLEASVGSDGPGYLWLRVIFAALSFIAFDLVIGAVVFRGWSWSGLGALLIAGAVSAAIGLDVSRVWELPALHAAPAVVLIAFGAHLMISRQTPAAEPPASTVNNTQINVGVLPRTLAQFAAARRAELSDITPEQFAAEIGTSVRSVEKLLGTATVISTTPEEG